MGKGASQIGKTIGSAVPAVGLGMSLFDTIKQSREQNAVADAAAKYQRQDLVRSNPYEGLKPSTLGADLRREEQQRIDAELIDAAKGAGTRGVVGAAGRIGANSGNVNADIAANLDAEQKAIDYAAAGDRVRTRDMIENREINDLNALGSQYNAAKDAKYQGYGNILQSAGYLGQTLAGMNGGETDVNALNRPSAQPVNTIPTTVPDPYGQFDYGGRGMRRTRNYLYAN